MNVRRFAKELVYFGANSFGANTGLRHHYRDRLLVLCYHNVVSDELPLDTYRGRNSVRVSQFDRQMATVSKLFSPISGKDLQEHLETGKPLPERAVLVTFDDGYRNNLVYALDCMERHRVPAIIHITTDHVGQSKLLWPQALDEQVLAWDSDLIPAPTGTEGWAVPKSIPDRWTLAETIRKTCKALPHHQRMTYLELLAQEGPSPELSMYDELYSFLTWDEIRQISDRGFDIGSHTVSHPILSTLEPEDLEIELRDSKRTIESELNLPCPWIAYPNGGSADFSEDVNAAAQAAGYSVAFTLTERLNQAKLDSCLVDRIGVPGGLSINGFCATLHGVRSAIGR